MPDSDNFLGLVDFLESALESTLLADANSVDTLKDTIESYSGETLEFQVSDSSGNNHVVKIPKIAITPLPLLRIQEAAFEVKGELIMNEVTEKTTQSETLTTPKISKDALIESQKVIISPKLKTPLLDKRAILTQKLKIAPVKSTETKSTSDSLSVTMNVKMAQADIPAGLTNLLQIAANNLQINENK